MDKCTCPLRNVAARAFSEKPFFTQKSSSLLSALVGILMFGSVHAVELDNAIDGVVKLDPSEQPSIQDIAGDVAATDLIDWTHLYTRKQGDDLYVVYKTVGNIDFVNNGWRYHLFMDTDLDNRTGFQGASDRFDFGADYMVEGGVLYKYTHDGFTWTWDNLGWVNFSYSTNTLEMLIDKARVDGELQKASLMLHASNETTEDYAYMSPVSIDGQFGDWDSLKQVVVVNDTVNDGNPADWKRMRFSMDPGAFLVNYETSTAIEPTAVDGATPGNMILFDIDENLATGFRGRYGELQMGAELMIQGGHVYRFEGGDWVKQNSAKLLYAYSGNSFEMSVPWDMIGLLGPKPMSIALYAQGNAASGTIDVLPDDNRGFNLMDGLIDDPGTDPVDPGGARLDGVQQLISLPVSVTSGQYLGFKSSSITAGAHIGADHRPEYASWVFTGIEGADKYQLANTKNSSLCLGAVTWTQGAVAMSCDGDSVTANQIWQVIGSGSDVQLKNAAKGQCLTTKALSNGSVGVVFEVCSDASNQLFLLSDSSSSGGDSTGDAKGLNGLKGLIPVGTTGLAVGWSKSAPGASVEVVSASQGSGWSFSFTPSDNTFLLQANDLSEARCLALPTWSNTHAILNRCDGGNRQKWLVEGSATNGYSLKNLETGTCLSRMVSSSEKLILRVCEGSDLQQFTVN